MITRLISLFILLSLFAGCGEEPGKINDRVIVIDDGEEKVITNGWTIPIEEIADGGPGKDGIPALVNPQFTPSTVATFIPDHELVIGVKHGDEVRVYPHQIIESHEIANDQIGDLHYALTFCFLTGTAIGWDREIDGEVHDFGVSGLLYNANLIPFDRQTQSNWSQILGESVNGNLVCTEVNTFNVVETTWGTWKAMYPNSSVLSISTGFDFDYENTSFGAALSPVSGLVFPVNPLDERLPIYERVHGIINDGKAKVYQFNNFQGGTSIIEDTQVIEPIIIVGNQDQNFIVSFMGRLEDGSTPQFEVANVPDPSVILTDDDGNLWNIFGEAVSGPRQGEKLTPTKSFMGFWFAFGGFFPDAEIYDGSSVGG